MRIAIFTDVLLEVPGGIPSSIFAQKKSLEAAGHRVTIFAPGFQKSLKVLPPEIRKSIQLVPTHALIKPNGAPLSKRPGLVKKSVLANFPDFNFDIIHVHYEASCSIAGMLLSKQFHLPLVQTMHGREDMAIQLNIPLGLKTITATFLCFLHGRYIPHLSHIKKATKTLAPTKARAKMWEIMVCHANFADQVVAPSKHFAQKLKTMGVSRPITVVSNGVDDNLIKPQRPRIFKSGEPLKLFWNSRLSKEKRVMPFLETLSLMQTPYFCTFVGDGNAYHKALRYSKKHHLSTSFLGRLPHEKVLEKMSDQHLSITVSYGFDTQGLTLLEAEAVGLPVFFCDPNMQEVAPKGSFIMSKTPEPTKMAQALDSIAKSPNLIEQMSRAMLAHRRKIAQSTQLDNLLKIYHNLVKTLPQKSLPK